MKTLNNNLPRIIAVAIFAVGLTPAAFGDAQINFGDTWLGVNDEGHLNVADALGVTINTSNTGLTYAPVGDATSPGCLCEGWGVAINGTTAMHANQVAGGITNITVDSFASTASTATSVVSMTSTPGLTITHAYQPSAAADVFEAVVTISNSTGAGVTDVRYSRAMDWDVPPTEFSEFVTIGGTATTADLLYSSDNGFANPNPLAAGDRFDRAGCGETVDFTDCGAADHGALFDFGFGDLADGEEITFSIFYGAAADEAGALAALGTIGAELFSFGQQNGDPGGGTPATFIFAFSGVGGVIVVPPSIPEPATLLLMGIGLAGLGLRRRSI
ncbi:MAG: PEP-CTERM sorting domain-containing protein [Gammaproteobacteria bacterium]|nr:PEP-CTERM sorting domain-containing protein [Gammaproteobacteria bacterium]